jgi:hypothetical protein
MLSRNNLLSTGEPNMVPTQDMVLDVILTTFDQRRKLNLQKRLKSQHYFDKSDSKALRQKNSEFKLIHEKYFIVI